MSGMKASEGRIYVAGTWDTKQRELGYVADRLADEGLRVATVDLSTGQPPGGTTFSAEDVAEHHPGGRQAVFTNDRGSAVAAMSEAFQRFVVSTTDMAGLIGLGGSGGTALLATGMRALPIGLPKILVSTIAAGAVDLGLGASDVLTMYSVTDISGLNRISRLVLANAAHAMAGMVRQPPASADQPDQPAIGLTMFGVTTPCVRGVTEELQSDFECLVFHATGTGGQSLEKLADSRLLAGVLDVTTTEVCDLLFGGVFPAGEDRLGVFARHNIPYVGSCGALDMINFGPPETVPSRYSGRLFYAHNPAVTLMRTTPEENAAMGRWIVERLNRFKGPLRFLIPEKGVSLLDSPGQPFHDPAADAALFSAIEEGFQPAANRQLVRLPLEINDPMFAAALVANFREVYSEV